MTFAIPALILALMSQGGCTSSSAPYDAKAAYNRDVKASRADREGGGFVPVRVTKVVASYSTETRADGKRLLCINAVGVVPKTGYLAPMLMPRAGLGWDEGWLEYDFRAIPNVEDGAVVETPILDQAEFLFNPTKTKIRGIRVFGADGTAVETRPDLFNTEPPPA